MTLTSIMNPTHFRNERKLLIKSLNKLFLWLNLNRLSLNIDKTNFLIFHPFNKPMKNRITIKINKKAIVEKNILNILVY